MARCRGCGKEIVFAEIIDEKGLLTGKTIPLDPKPPVYLVTNNGHVSAEREKRGMVSHFSTCSKANDFSGARRRENNA